MDFGTGTIEYWLAKTVNNFWLLENVDLFLFRGETLPDSRFSDRRTDSEYEPAQFARFFCEARWRRRARVSQNGEVQQVV
jgi:hypothetical protein